MPLDLHIGILELSTQINVWTHKFYTFACNWLMPLGLVILLMGLTVLPERSLYHKLFYVTIAAPTLLALLLRSRSSKAIWLNPVIITFLLFSAWALLSVNWSDTDQAFSSLLKRPLYILMLFAACALMALHNHERLAQSTLLAALLMLPITLYCLADFISSQTLDGRLVGTGALDNPLLSSHIFGFFCALWLALSMTLPARQGLPALIAAAVMGAAVLATGSRTPLLATAMTCAWLIVACWNKRAIWLMLSGAAALVALVLIHPETLSSRGLSYRPELWIKTLSKVAEQPWHGFGFDAHLTIFLADMPTYGFSEPHSFALGVLYYTGIIGLIIWLAMHALALFQCWKHKGNFMFIVCGALLVYGIGAGLTEGGGILSRPKEHWLVTWVPLALIAALSIRTQQAQSTRS
ncbi:O-antigen ligase family protein [Stutzerimonas nitrititolerans]|uniref:O-antigen ligase family protein n=1 Tax=Stutzerimonas nitrititolerans TaxID=2482751 RepID=UPI0028A1F5FF|nr:O-antigen ligase family protein [Stutzerimonas nitrititolerans]